MSEREMSPAIQFRMFEYLVSVGGGVWSGYVDLLEEVNDWGWNLRGHIFVLCSL